MPLTLKKRGEYFYLRGTVRGIPVYESTGTGDEAVAEQVREAREDELTQLSIHGPKATTTFAKAADSYIEAGGSDRFLIRVRKTDGVQRGLMVHFRETLLKDIGQHELDAAARKLLPDASPETRNRQVYTPFIAVWNHAVAAKWADKHEWKRPRKKKGTAPSVRKVRAGTKPVSYERAWEFVSAMSPAAAAAMTALFYTGMRPIELFALEAGQVNVPGRWIVLPETKPGEPRGVPLHEVLVPMFSALAERGGAMFRTHLNEAYPITEEGGGQISSAIDGARRRLKRAGRPINDISPYTARHTVSTQLVLNGVHAHIKDAILGHAVTDMSRHYTSIPQKPLIDAINTLPVIEAWAASPWMAYPVTWQRRLVPYSAWGKTKRSRAKSVQPKPKSATT